MQRAHEIAQEKERQAKAGANLGAGVEEPTEGRGGGDFHPIGGARVHLQGAAAVGHGCAAGGVEALTARDRRINLARDEVCQRRGSTRRISSTRRGRPNDRARARSDRLAGRRPARTVSRDRIVAGAIGLRRLHAVGHRSLKRDGSSRIHARRDYTEACASCSCIEQV